MKKLMVLAFIFVLHGGALQAQEWKTDFGEAQNLAAEQDRNIVLVFQGSDWCAPCIKLDREVWSTEAFQNYSKDHFVMLKADFPRKRNNKLNEAQQKQNNELAEKYNRQGIFPFVVLLDKEGKVLGQTGYQKMNSTEYIDLLASFEK